MDQEYERLVAAHFLRVPSFTSRYGPLLLSSGSVVLGSLWLRDPVTYGVEHFLETGRLLPKSALLHDIAAWANKHTHYDNYRAEVDPIFQIPWPELSNSSAHVAESFVEQTQLRALNALDWQGLLSEHRVEALMASVEEIRSYRADSNGKAVRLSEALREALRSSPKGVPTGLYLIDEDLQGGGVCPGETMVWYGPKNSGKSMCLQHIGIHASSLGFRGLFWSLENSRKNVALRLGRGILGTPTLKEEDVLKIKGKLFDNLHLKHSAGVLKIGQIEREIEVIEQDTGEKLDFLIVDYSEKRAEGYGWEAVRRAYEDVRVLCSRREIAGFDAAQKNAQGAISYHGILKDADIGIELTPSESCHHSIEAHVDRNREGPAGGRYPLWINFDRAEVKINVPMLSTEEETQDG